VFVPGKPFHPGQIFVVLVTESTRLVRDLIVPILNLQGKSFVTLEPGLNAEIFSSFLPTAI
jgi:hypothetical protein